LTFNQLIFSIIVCFSLFAVTNIVIRFTVFRMYSDLRKKGVELSGKCLFDKQTLDKEVNSGYIEHAELIYRFVKYTRFAMTFATILIGLIMIMGYLLLKTR